MKLVDRKYLIAALGSSVSRNPITALLGARQTGKTTLAHLLAESCGERVHFFDLERAADRAALAEPETALSSLRGLVIIDEVQRMPTLFETLRPLSDRPSLPARFMILGSASPDLVRGVSESLAGRVALHEIPGFSLDEVGKGLLQRLWLRGGFPRAFLAEDDAEALRWREDFVELFLERDIPRLGIRVSTEALRRFWTMLAHHHGQMWNASELARSLQVNEKTARHYLDILVGAYVVQVLPPWHENLKKRQVKSPKVYIRDTGLLHALLGIETMRDLTGNPKYGASWEGFALEQILMRYPRRRCWFWRTQRGAELDLMIIQGGRRIGFEFKCSDAPAMTPSMSIALEDLALDQLSVIYPGSRAYALSRQVMVLPLADMSGWEK